MPTLSPPQSRSRRTHGWRGAISLSKLVLLLLLGVSSISLTACGLRGSLQPAPPIFGSARQAYEAQKKAQAEAEAAKAAKTDPGNAPTQAPPDPGSAGRSSLEIPAGKPQS